jgi:hypothetical protein
MGMMQMMMQQMMDHMMQHDAGAAEPPVPGDSNHAQHH